MRKSLILFLAAAFAAVSLTGCKSSTITGASSAELTSSASADSETAGEKRLKVSESFALQTLDPHLDYQGWYTSIYGVTETLFFMSDQSSIEPLLAESAEANGTLWTIKLKKNAVFSNGNPVTSDMVIRNLKAAGNVNSRFAYLTGYTYEVLDDTTFTIDTGSVYPTLLNDLASPELAIVDLDSSKDMKTELIATGPFVISSFEAGGTMEVARNDHYWNGEVKLDGAVFYYMPEADTALMAMQNGEIDAYTSVTSDAAELYQKNPETYNLTTIPASRLQFYILNENRMDASLRKAVNLTVDSEAIETYLNGTVSKTDGPFSPSAPYGKVKKDKVDVNAAKALLEADGYTLNADGYYEKDGKVLTLNLAYYAARSLDTLAALMQEQLKAAGIQVVLTCEEDPDGTYIATGDFDIALYCMIADKAGDPYYFISCTLAEGAPYNCGGFSNPQVQEMILQLAKEPDTKKRAQLADQIVQAAMDEDAFGYVALFNKITVMRNGVKGVAENNPFDFYFLNADTDMD
jgi:peptide/nickel transport system substrate-binding protein